MTVFVPNGESQGLTATWLLHSADENDIDRRSIKTTRGGFNIPDDLAAAIGYAPKVAESEAPAPPVPAVTLPAAEDKTPPAGWDEPQPTPDVVVGSDGKIYLTDEAAAREAAPAEMDREVVRAWAKEQGLNPAQKGALKKSVMDQYAAAHPEG